MQTIAVALPLPFLLLLSAVECFAQLDHRNQPFVVAPELLRSGNAVVSVQAIAGPPRAGLFNIGTANGKSLLYDFPREDCNSHINVWVGGELASNAPDLTGLPALPLYRAPMLLADGAITCAYLWQGVVIEQRLEPEQYTDSTGAIFIQYLIANQNDTAREVGLLLELDTKVGDNDRAPYWTNSGYVGSETVFTGSQVPDFYQAFEFRPDTSGLVAQGTLALQRATRPQLFMVGDFLNLADVQWNYVPNGLEYSDSAILLRWDPIRLAGSQTIAVGTYYGVGEVTTESGQLSLNASAPNRIQCEKDSLSPNPFNLQLIITNTGFSAAEEVQARVELAAGLELAEGESAQKMLPSPQLAPQAVGTLSWRIRAGTQPADQELKMKITASALNAPENSVERRVVVARCPAGAIRLEIFPESQTVIAGDSALFLAQLYSVGNRNEEVELDLVPRIDGIEYNFTPARIIPGSSSRLTLRTSNQLAAGTYSLAVEGVSAQASATDTLVIRVEAARQDRKPPLFLNHNPARNAGNILPQTAIEVDVLDEESGVDSASIQMLVNDLPVSYELTRVDRGYHLRHEPPRPFSYNEVVRVHLRAQDRAALPNEVEDDYSFSMVRDVSPPFTTDHVPPRNSDVPRDIQTLAFHLRDDLSGVDSASIALSIAGVLVQPLISGTPQDYTVRYDFPEALSPGDSVRIGMEASDLALPPNSMLRDEYVIRIQETVIDLVAETLRPVGTLQAGVAGKIEGAVHNAFSEVTSSFRVQLLLNGTVTKDTSIAALAAGENISVQMPVLLQQSGLYSAHMIVDADGTIAELSETNNSIEFLVELLPAANARLVVRPNPFTPNQDGINDEVKFNYAGLQLKDPSLEIFDLEGVTVISIEGVNSGQFVWDGRDRNGRPLPPGLYLYSLQERGENVANGYVVLAR